ncbi:hypothetical protein OKW40_001101 [Paraburkholderia sp. RAU6.4a]|uniref:hypothetical protein n=1 Tax=Paraburkholderia sp. RAU6.4a TaxID=2991067 RepID=UPI003D1CD384
MNDYEFPWVASKVVLCAVFFISLLLFHIIFVYAPPTRLGKRGLKIIDYFYLGAGSLGLLGSIATNRVDIAKNMLSLANDREEFAYRQVVESISTDLPLIICRKFVPSELSPPNLSETKRQYDLACDWLKDLRTKIPSVTPQDPDEVIALNKAWVTKPKIDDPALIDNLKEGDIYIADFNARYKELEYLNGQGKTSELEDVLHILAPFFIAIAVALRVTKVTGELKIDAEV